MRSFRYALASLLFLTPLLFGSVEFWSLAAMELASVLIFLSWFIAKIRDGRTKLSFIKPPMLVPLGLLSVIAILQIVPVPPEVLRLISPRTYLLYNSVPFYENHLPWLALSLYPYSTALEIVRLASYLIVYFLAIQMLRDKESINGMASVILAAGVFIALIGIFQMIFWNGKLLWLRDIGGGMPFGPYVNRNHFAGLMEMIIPVSIGMGVHLYPRIRSREGFRTLVADLFIYRQANRLILTIAGVVIMTTALFLSLSRSGIVALTLSMIFFGIMLFVRRSTRRKGWIIIGLCLIVLFAVGWFGWQPIIDRFEKIGKTEQSSEYRLHNWKDSIEIIKAFPIFGTGLGAYEHIYPRFKTIAAQSRWEHAHNDYIEGAVESGVPGLLIALSAICAFYISMFRMIMRRKSFNARLLGMGGMTGVTALLIHSLTDFNLHIGANGFYFSFLVGFSIAASHAKMRDSDDETLLDTVEIPFTRKKRSCFSIGVVTVCLILSALLLLNTIAESYYILGNGPLNEKAEVLDYKRELIERARTLNPFDARYPLALGNIDSVLGRKEDALREYVSAVALDPVNAGYLQMLGAAYDNAGNRDAAEKYMKLALINDPTSAWLHKNYALWLFSKGEKEGAMSEMRRAIALEPSNTRNYIMAMALARLTIEEMREVIPDKYEARLLFGRYIEELGDMENALASYLDALSSMKNEGIAPAEIYRRIAGIYEKKGMTDQALLFYEEGVRQSPDDASLRFSLARLYDKLNITYRAVDEYEKVVMQNPSNDFARRRLKELRGNR